MTTLKSTFQTDLQDAIRNRDEIRMATLRMALAAIATAEVAGDTARDLSDDEVRSVLRREAKKRREAATAFADAGRADRADRERAEHAVLEAYLPRQLDDDELAELVRSVIQVTEATGPKMGEVMRAAQAMVGERAEGGRVAAEVRRQLGS
ncbi:MAG: GatB/YqeY domain-containing protein [Angustibacter sp.]